MDNTKKLNAFVDDIDILSLTIDIPYYEKLEDRCMYGTYESTLLRVFNNKREHREDILEIINYYGSNELKVVFNFTHYREDSYNTEEEDIKHLKRWLIGNFDLSEDAVKEERFKGRLYTINEYNNNIDTFKDYIVVSEW